MPFRQHAHDSDASWVVVLLSAGGLAIAAHPMSVLSFGAFLKPLSADFGWSRAQLSGALTLHMIISMIAAPLIGRLIDRHDARRLIAISFPFYGLAFACQSLMVASLPLFYFSYAATAVIGAGTSVVAFTKIVSGHFARRRGLALGLTVAGSGLGAIAVPLLTQYLISHWGWRTAYLSMGLACAATGVLVSLSLFRVTRPFAPDAPAPSAAQQQAEAIHFGRAFWLMIGAFFLIGLSFAGVTLHIIPMLSDRGISPDTAARVQASVGASLLAGRILTAFLLDRVRVPLLAAALLPIASCGLAMLVFSDAVPIVYGGAILLGFAAGAEVDVMAVLVVRIFGLAQYGRVYGWLYCLYLLGAALGPLVAASSYDLIRSYDASNPLFMIGLLIATLAFLLLARVARSA